ncbi:MAG: hypothetical protein ACYC2U_08295 [Candidatus Amoebophilus sp.]
MRSELYLKLQALILSIKGIDGLSIIKHVDLWNQNTSFLEQETPFADPAVFIEFLPFQWQQLGQQKQQASITIRLHVVSKWWSNTASNNPTQSTSVKYLDLTETIFAAIQGKSTTATNGLMRTNSTTNHNHQTYVDSIEEYTTLITATNAIPVQQSINNVQPIITEE